MNSNCKDITFAAVPLNEVLRISNMKDQRKRIEQYISLKHFILSAAEYHQGLLESMWTVFFIGH